MHDFSTRISHVVNFSLSTCYKLIHKGNVLPFSGNSYLCKEQEIIFFVVENHMNGRSNYPSSLIYASGTNTPGHSPQKFNTHDHFGKLDIFARKLTHTDECSIFRRWKNQFYIS